MLTAVIIAMNRGSGSIFDNSSADFIGGAFLIAVGWLLRDVRKTFATHRTIRMWLTGRKAEPGIPGVLPAPDRLTHLECNVERLKSGQEEIAAAISTNGDGSKIGAAVIEIRNLMMEHHQDAELHPALKERQRSRGALT